MIRPTLHSTHKKSEDVAPALLALTIQMGKETLIHGTSPFTFTDGLKGGLRKRLALRKDFPPGENEKEWGGACRNC